jgi:hypothetical protein
MPTPDSGQYHNLLSSTSQQVYLNTAPWLSEYDQSDMCFSIPRRRSKFKNVAMYAPLTLKFLMYHSVNYNKKK